MSTKVLEDDCPVVQAGKQLLADREIARNRPFRFAPALLGSRVRIYKQDPTVADLNFRTVYLPDDVQVGPADKAIRIAGLPPIFPNIGGDLMFHPETAATEFDASHTFAVVRMALTMVERMLGAAIPWQWNSDGGERPIDVFPHGGEGANAHYWREEKELRFFHFVPQGTTKRVFTCQSLDIVGHETGHAILDALRPDWYDGRYAQLGGLHEAFGDIVSILLILSQFDMADFVVAETKADLHQKSALSALAEEFGAALYKRDSGLRNADNDLKLSEVSNEVHSISQVVTGAVFDILADFYTTRRDPRKHDDTAVLHKTAADIGRVVLKAFQQADTGTEKLKHNAFSSVASTMHELAQKEFGNELARLVRYHFERREVMNSDIDFTGVPARASDSCGTARIINRRDVFGAGRSAIKSR